MFKQEPIKKDGSVLVGNAKTRGLSSVPVQKRSGQGVPPSLQAKLESSQSMSVSSQMQSKAGFPVQSATEPIQRAEGENIDTPMTSTKMYVYIDESISPLEMEPVRFREKPSEDSKVLKILVQNESVDAFENKLGWFKVRIDGKEGYVSDKFLKQDYGVSKEGVSQENMTPTMMYVNTETDPLCLRSEPNVADSKNIIGRLKKGTRVEAFARCPGWFKVKTSNKEEGYVSAQYVKSVEITDVSDIDMSKFEHRPFDPDPWNDFDTQPVTNCYAYAFDYLTNPINGEEFERKLQPGDLYIDGMAKDGIDAKEQEEIKEWRRQNDEKAMLTGTPEGNALLVEWVKKDAKAVGYTFTELTVDSEGGHVVALVVDPDPYFPDYHWYRTNTKETSEGDTTWSHKRGGWAATETVEGGPYPEDARGDSFIDPKIAGDAVDYTVFVGYFVIKKANK